MQMPQSTQAQYCWQGPNKYASSEQTLNFKQQICLKIEERSSNYINEKYQENVPNKGMKSLAS